jgi:hypothetical protein
MLSLLIVAALVLADPTPGASPPGASITADATHDGSDVDHAIIVTAPDELTGVDAEDKYLSTLTCGSAGHWKLQLQATLSHAGRHYDRFDVRCSEGDAARSFFFDVTSFFGKL